MTAKKPNYSAVAQRNKTIMERQATVGADPQPETVSESPVPTTEPPDSKPRRGRPSNQQERVPFTTRVRADVRKTINVGAAAHDVKPSDVIDALVDQFFDTLDWNKVGTDRR